MSYPKPKLDQMFYVIEHIASYDEDRNKKTTPTVAVRQVTRVGRKYFDLARVDAPERYNTDTVNFATRFTKCDWRPRFLQLFDSVEQAEQHLLDERNIDQIKEIHQASLYAYGTFSLSQFASASLAQMVAIIEAEEQAFQDRKKSK